jgi:DNA-binding transcriptional MerR regulator
VAVIKGRGQPMDVRGDVARHGNSSRASLSRADEQGLLFGDEVPASPDDVGYRGPTACTAAGITYRQLDYWARTGLVEPSVRPASGSGSQRLYGFRDILALKVVKRLLDTGISLQQIRTAVAYLREQGAGDIAQVTLMSDGASVYACTSPDEVVDLLQGGQGVFGIALGRVWQEVEGTLADLPAERAEEALPADTAGAAGAPGSRPSAPATDRDELSRRRARKTG